MHAYAYGYVDLISYAAYVDGSLVDATMTSALVSSQSILQQSSCSVTARMQRAAAHEAPPSSQVFTVNELTYQRARGKEADVLQDLLKREGDRGLDDQTWLSAKGYVRVWDVFGPNYNCLYSRERLGRTGDGGKWVCGPGFLLQSKSCVVYSIGSYGEVSFEQALLSMTQCEVYTFDHTLNEAAQAVVRGVPGLHFHNVGLGVRQTGQEGHPSRVLSLDQLMENLKHSWIDVLKVDVEGAEWALIQEYYSPGNASLPVTQLLIELHTSNPPDGSMLQTVVKVFQLLLDDGYRVFSVEPNTYCLGGACAKDHVEYSMIKVSRAGHVIRPGVHVAKLDL